MKNILRFIGSMLICGLTVGCATVAKGPSYSEAKSIRTKPGFATLYIFREYAEPTAWGAKIQVDSKPVTTLNQNGFTWIYVKPGTKEIKAVWPVMSGQKDSFISIDVGDAKTHYLELIGVSKLASISYSTMYFKMGSGLNEVQPEVAVKRLEACCKFQKPTSTAL